VSRRTLRNSRTRTAAVGGALCVALLLAGCSNDGGDGDGGVIPGTEQGDDTDPTAGEDEEQPQDEEPEDDGIDRPEIDLGDAYENVYADEYTGDPVKDAILRDSEGFQDAVAEAILHFETDRPALRFYLADDALEQTMRLMQRVIDGGKSSTGTARYYNREVSVFDETSGAVVFCRDFTQVATTDFESGEVVEEADAEALPSIYTTRVEKNELGVWQTVSYTLEREAEECR
jgi:hypothetical protein